MDLSRRGFLKVMGASGAALAAGSKSAAASVAELKQADDYGCLVDTTLCVGCRKCEEACNERHSLPKPEASYAEMTVLEKERRMDETSYTVVNKYYPKNIGTLTWRTQPTYVKFQCMHCNDPSCVSACIVGAFSKSEKGPVVYDAWKCIGCRYCIVACPFQVPAYEYDNALTPQVRKCTFCHERLDKGELPACVTICPNEALTFGPRQELIDLAHSRFKANPGRYHEHVYGEHEVGGTSWMYLTAVDTKLTELPTLPEAPMPPLTETIQHGIFKSFVPPVALYALLGLIMYTNSDKDKEQEVEK